MKFDSLENQWKFISRGAEEIIPEEELKRKLEFSRKKGEPLKIKLGCDPSRPDLHVGHGVVLRKLNHFQQLGHQAILVIGDFTAMIGDPSGRNKTRPQLTLEEAKENAKSYIDQASKILDIDSLKIVYNSDWLNTMNFSDVIRLTSHYTVARMLERDDFHKRYKSNQPISIHEFLYPLLQAYDSVELNADIELGGTDQKFNLLLGREVQKIYGQEPQSVITLPLLEGLDGTKKMSKSLNNYIAIDEGMHDMFGKLMSISDKLMWRYFDLLSFKSSDEIKELKKSAENGENPRNIKFILAKEITERFHGKNSGEIALEEFKKRFQKGEMPSVIDERIIKYNEKSTTLPRVLKDSGLVSSTSEAIRLIKQGGIRIEGKKISDEKVKIEKDSSHIYQVGKKKFLRIKIT